MRKAKKNFIITIVAEKTDTGYSAFACDSEKYPIFTTGSTINKLLDNAVEAAQLYFENSEISIGKENIKIEIDLKQFFQYYRVVNSVVLADKIGMNPTLLSHYVQGKKKPSTKQVNRILEGVRDIGKELMNIELVP